MKLLKFGLRFWITVTSIFSFWLAGLCWHMRRNQARLVPRLQRFPLLYLRWSRCVRCPILHPVIMTFKISLRLAFSYKTKIANRVRSFLQVAHDPIH